MTELFARMFRKMTPLQSALTELEEAKLELLKLESVADYATNMVNYHQQRIARLKTRIAEFKEDIA
jgi:hypothetical protein